MDEKLFLIRNNEEINDIIQTTFKFKQRFKLSCFDVSPSLLVFGASNGSLYIFKRNPCEFLNLIPSKNGVPVLEVAISPNEKHLSVMEPNGTFTILENCFDPSNFQCHNFFEHKGSTLTYMKWQDDKLYVGDKDGTIGLATLPDLLSKTILQMPYISLMNLENEIVQIDPFGKFLLVTTSHRTYLCDTEREVYKKIGKSDKKSKSNGGCFFFLKGDFTSEIKVFCSKPKAQFWEANVEGEVIFTHKYKQAALDLKEIYCIDQNDLKIININYNNDVIFGKTYLFNERFLIAIESNSFNIIDPIKSKILIRYNFDNIVDTKIINNEIWVFDYKLERMEIYLVNDLKGSIEFLNANEKFDLCLTLCLKFQNDVLKLAENVNFEISLKDTYEKSSKNSDELELLILNFNDLKIKKELEYKEMMSEKEIVFKNSETVEDKIIPEEKVPDNFKVIYVQYKLNESYEFAETVEFLKLLKSLNVNELCGVFLSSVEYFKKSEPNMEKWCRVQFLSRISLEDLANLDEHFKIYVTNSFLEINESKESCGCGFPLPKAFKRVPQFYEIGCKLMNENQNIDEFFKRVPYMWKNYLENLNDFEIYLPAILQFGDYDILKYYSSNISFDVCDKIINQMVKLKRGKCLNCENEIDDENISIIISWKDLGIFLIPFIGSENVLKLFLYRAGDINNEELGTEFYQICIFAKNATKINDEKSSRDKSVELAKQLTCGDKTRKKFAESIETFLGNKGESNPERFLTYQNCLHCDLPINNDILYSNSTNHCEHPFHSICFDYIENKCSLCIKK